ncbi:MAG: hypothetical protein WDZ93_01740 [Candidatus Paceibacterota bacterium]
MNQMVCLVTADSVCADILDSIKTKLAQTTITIDEIPSELTDHYSGHLFVKGVFGTELYLGIPCVTFTGYVCGEKRTITVF